MVDLLLELNPAKGKVGSHLLEVLVEQFVGVLSSSKSRTSAFAADSCSSLCPVLSG